MNNGSHLDIRVTVAGNANTMKPGIRKVGYKTGAVPKILYADAERSGLQFVAEPNGGSLEQDRTQLHDEIVAALETEGIQVLKG